MDVFKMFDFSWKHPIRSIKYFFRALRWSRQRVKKGYCDWDVMDIDTWFAELMPRMLRDFKSRLTEQEHPILPEFFDEYYALFIENSGMSKEEFNEALYSYELHDEYSEKYHLWCAKRWREIIEEMAVSIEEVNKYEQEYGEELEEKKDKALALFGKYFFNLWY